MKLKSRLIMILLLTTMLLLMLLGGLVRNDRLQEEGSQQNETSLEPVDGDPVRPDSFKGTVDDPYGIPAAIMNVITSYMDDYYRTLFTLEKQDTAKYFADLENGKVSDLALSLLVDTRRMYDFDFRLKEGHYDLKVVSYHEDGGVYHIDILEDDYMVFRFLDPIVSEAYGIENHFELVNSDGSYKIKDLDKQQGYYLCIHEEAGVSDLDEVYDYYYQRLKGMIQYDAVLCQRAHEQPFEYADEVSVTYDRDAAVAYSYRYCHERNEEWYNFSDEGGNCQNYASQCLLSGGIEMDHEGDHQWKCYIDDPEYDPEIDEYEEPYGRSRSWVHVPSFYEYVLNNRNGGPVTVCGTNLFYAEPGDLVLVGNSGPAHTVIVSKIVDDHILVNSNSIDMKDFPLEAYTYVDVTLVKVIGSD